MLDGDLSMQNFAHNLKTSLSIFAIRKVAHACLEAALRRVDTPYTLCYT